MEMKLIGQTYSVSDYGHYERVGDKNYFEEIIDMMILEGIPGMDESFRSLISNMDRSKKRMAILSILDKDRSLFLKIKALINKDINRMDHIKDVVLMLRKYVKVGDVEKKKFGEVMTPLELVKEMLATLPEEVWSNPRLKWLDPANGTGPYPIMVIYKLMKGLADWEPDAEKRYKHIVENMIYVCELQPKNMFLYICAVDPFDAYKLNIYTGSFLEQGFDYHMKNVWKLDGFHVVLGNPPYQSSSTDIRGSKSIYNLFVDKSNCLSKQTLMVTPSRWFSNKNMESFRKDMLSKYGLKILNECDKDTFKNTEIKGGVSYFLLQKNYEGLVNFNGELKKFDSGIIDVDIDRLMKYIPENSTFLSDSFVSGAYFGIETNDTRLNNNINNIKCYVSKMNGLTKYIELVEVPQKPNLNRYKLLVPSASGSKNNIGSLGRFEIGYPNEVCSSSFSHFSFDTEEECISLRSYLNTKFIKFLIKVKKPTQRVKKDVFSLVPTVPFDRIWTDEKVYNYFNLSSEDIKFLDKLI